MKISLAKLFNKQCHSANEFRTSFVGAVTLLILLSMGFFSLLNSSPASAASVLTLNLDSSNLLLNLTPTTTAGSFNSADLNLSVTLSKPGGYTLGIIADSSSYDSGKLINADDSSAYFSSISDANGVAESTFSSSSTYNNMWGYKPSKYNSMTNENDLYYPSPDATKGDILDNITNNFSGTNNYTITLGARANVDTKVGSYTGAFIITAVATITCNPNATMIGDAICMQDVNDNVINSMVEGTQYQLMDNRDDKVYYVAKMKDGRVWMTQNLDLDLRTDTTAENYVELNHSNTDLGWTTNDTTVTWVPSTATVTTVADYGANNSTAPASYDPGDVYYYYDKTANTTTTYNSNTAKADCEAAHSDGTCDHYHVGNYYNWTAAVAMNSSSSIDANYTSANDSICPAGWRLPTGRTSTTSTDPGYYSEINYTWVSEGLATSYVTGNGTATYGTSGWNNIRSNPMYMVAAGYKNGTSAPASTASYGYHWTSTNASSTSYAYAPYFYSSGLYPAYYNSSNTVRGRGMSIRCIARQENTGHTTITFNANASTTETGSYTGNTGDVNNQQTISANTLTNLDSNGFSISGYAFNSWNTESDGSGTSYTDAAQFYAKTGTETTNTTLYAIWDKVYTITFQTSNAQSITFDGITYTNGQTAQIIADKTYNISGNYATKYGFSSWSVTAGTLANSNYPVTTYTVTGDATITLTGQEATTDITTLSASGEIPSNCATTTPVRNLQLVYDSRDNEAYWVAELCDGKIWMLDNLRLDLTKASPSYSGSDAITLTTSNTNASEQAISCLTTGSYGGTACSSPYATAAVSNWTSSYAYSAPKVNSTYKDTVAPVTYGLGSGKIGVYYNYCAASAGSYCWGNGTSSSGSPSSDPNTETNPTARDIEGDICPAGWRMPTGGSYNTTTGGGEYQNLYSKYSSNVTNFRNAFSTPLSGVFNNGSAGNQGTDGDFWSSTWASTISMYYLYVNSSSVSPSYSYYRNSGASVRCILGSS